MTPKQRRFVAEYLKDQNATQAAIRAGFSAKTAHSSGPRLLDDVGVKAAIEAGMKKVEAKAEVSAEYVLTSLKEIVERCMQRVPVMVFDKEDKKMIHATQTVKDEATGELREEGLWEFDANGANGALKMLGTHLKLFTEKVEHSGAVTVGWKQLAERAEKERGLGED